MLDCQTSKMKLLFLPSFPNVMMLTFLPIRDFHSKLLDEKKEGKYEDTDEFHNLSSGYEKLLTQRTLEFLNNVGMPMGGAEHFACSGIPYLIAYFASAVIY